MFKKHFETNKFHMVLRSRAKRRETSITILPEEIIFNILVLLPAEILYNVMRYVCRQWYMIIEDPRFVSTHSLLSTNTILRKSKDNIDYQFDTYQILDVREGYSKLPGFKFRLPSPVRVVTTCNGLVLMVKELRKSYYIGNPITRRILTLPKFLSFVDPRLFILAFEASSKLYKVVVVFFDRRTIGTLNYNNKHFGCAILTVGVDEAWRVLEEYAGHVSGYHYVIPGFVYFLSISSGQIFVLDVASENMKVIKAPSPLVRFLPNGNSISFVRFNQAHSIGVWVLKDHNNEEWVKVSPIEDELIRSVSEDITPEGSISKTLPRPIMWLQCVEKTLFRRPIYLTHDLSSNGSMNSPNSCIPSGHFYLYDLNTLASSEFEKNCERDSVFFPFTKSLAWV